MFLERAGPILGRLAEFLGPQGAIVDRMQCLRLNAPHNLFY